jgi:hypothetical protein
MTYIRELDFVVEFVYSHLSGVLKRIGYERTTCLSVSENR